MNSNGPESKEQGTNKKVDSSCNQELNSASASRMMVDKAIQIDMDYEPGDDPSHNKRYWRNIAGLRGARAQYLELDIRDYAALYHQQREYVNFLKLKLVHANKEIKKLASPIPPY